MVEWDGKTPPTTWYSRLHGMGLWVRGNKDTSPIERRACNAGVVYQEGSIIVKSESLAHTLASMAYSMGAKTVSLGSFAVDTFYMSPTDQAALEKISTAWSRRGPKSHEDEGIYTITCTEQAATFEVDLREKPMTCPDCGSLAIQWRRGIRRNVQPRTAKESAFDFWAGTRFIGIAYEIPNVDLDGETHLPPTGLNEQAQAVEKFYATLPQYVKDSNIELVARVLDIAYSLQSASRERRIAVRLAALNEYYASGGDKTFAVNPSTAIDLVDVAGIDGRLVAAL